MQCELLCVCVCVGCARMHGVCTCVSVCAWDVHVCAWNVFMGSVCMGCAQLYAPDVRMGCVRVHGMHTVACISCARGMCVRARDAHVCVQGVCTSMCRALCTQRPRSRTSRCTPGPAGSSVGDAGRRWDGRSPPGAVWVGVGAELDGRGVPGGGRWGSPRRVRSPSHLREPRHVSQ